MKRHYDDTLFAKSPPALAIAALSSLHERTQRGTKERTGTDGGRGS